VRVKMQPFFGRRFLTVRHAGLVNFIMTTHGRLEIAVTNAGIGGEMNAVADMSIEGGQKVIAINLNSVLYDNKYR
jgi:NAD(P)-dependent dehydrogenase (short-subunit alcohol dehydrogenase family)